MVVMPESVTLSQRSDVIEVLEIDNEFATASISLWGAHMLSFEPKHDSRERLWVSETARFDGSKSIRGGIPVCWPWFGSRDDDLQAHGYARKRYWRVINASDEPLFTEITLELTDTAGKGFEGAASLLLTIRVGDSLSVSLSTENTGDTAFTYNGALHTYFDVLDINHTELQGLSGDYSDKTQNWAILPTPEPYRFSEETDRIHLNPVGRVSIAQGDGKTTVDSVGHDSLVVWNPWTKRSADLVDMADDGYLGMLCVETAVTQGKTLEPGEVHVLEQTIS